MGKSVGIDLGTTNSVAAFKFAELEVVTASDNSPPDRKLTRSVVSFNQNQLVIGDEAYRQLRADPENVIISIKRLIGRGFGDEVVQKQLSRFGYRITQSNQGTENSLVVWLGGKEYTPEDISAEILKKVLQNAQIYQSQSGQKTQITQAVVTIPAYFNDKQRYATQIAAKKANIQECELLPEPTAAAISYGFKPDSDDTKTILVYDFGGGTFDSSIITASGNQFIESGKAGDLWLGGDDIDYLLNQYVKEQVAQQENLDDIDGLITQMPYYQRVRFQGDLKMAVEKAKIDLSYQNSAKIIPPTPLLDDLGMAIPIEVEITRHQFESMILPMVERSIAICQDTIKYSDFLPESIDVVLLVGGSSQIPLVQRKVAEAFGQNKIVVHPRPMYAVAEGAAIVAAGLTEKVGTVSRDYFIELVDNPRHPIVNRNDILPVKNSHTFKTEADGQRLIHFKFFSPDTVSEDLDLVKRDERLGDMWLALNQAYPKATEVSVMVELDEKNSALTITAALKNDPSIRVSSSFSRGGEDEKISKTVESIIEQLNQEKSLTARGVERVYELAGEAVTAANQIRAQDGTILVDREEVAVNKLRELQCLASDDYEGVKYYIRNFEFILESCPSLLPHSQQQRLQNLTGNLKQAIDTFNLSSVQKLLEDARREFDNLPDTVKLIVYCLEGISHAHQINPSEAKIMLMKFQALLGAIDTGNGAEADRILQELIPQVSHYLDQDIPTNTIATGLIK